MKITDYNIGQRFKLGSVGHWVKIVDFGWGFVRFESNSGLIGRMYSETVFNQWLAEGILTPIE